MDKCNKRADKEGNRKGQNKTDENGTGNNKEPIKGERKTNKMKCPFYNNPALDYVEVTCPYMVRKSWLFNNYVDIEEGYCNNIAIGPHNSDAWCTERIIQGLNYKDHI